MDHSLQLPSPFHLPPRGGDVKRVAILGIGNELNGDDIAGVLVARQLKAGLPESATSAAEEKAVLIVEGGAAPENFTGTLRRFRPDLVIFVDAADLGAAPGTLAWLNWDELDGLSASTHTLPPSILAKYIQQELGCHIALIGIQPAHLNFDMPISGQVGGAVERLVQELTAWL